MSHLQSDFLRDIECHKGIIFKVSKVYFDDADDQEDLRQEIIYQLWNSYDSFKSESQFSTWMYRVAINTAILFFKKEKKKQTQISEYGIYINTQIEDSNNDEENLKILYKAIQHLDKIEKAIIFMYLEDMSHEMIAKNLGISNANARVKLHRAKEKLKTIIFKNKNLEL